MSSSPASREASCSCGQLRALVTGEPFRVGVCHCLECQRRTGGPFAAQAWWHGEQVTIEGRSAEWTRYNDQDGTPCTFSFCPVCSATVFFQNARLPDTYAIPVGAFADPTFPPPQRSTWEERQHSWVIMPEGIEHIY